MTRVLSIAVSAVITVAAFVGVASPAQGTPSAGATATGHVVTSVKTDATPSGTISGHVSLGTAGHAATAGEVAVVYSTNGPAKFNCCSTQVVTDANGDYAISAYVGVRYFLYFKYLGAGAFSSDGPVDPPTNDGGTTLDASGAAVVNKTLPVAASLVGTVHLGDGATTVPSGSVNVSAQEFLGTTPIGSESSPVAVDSTGHYAVPVSPGQYALHFTYVGSGGYQSKWYTAGGFNASNDWGERVYQATVVDFRGGTDLDTDVVLPPTRSLSGHVYLGTSATPAGAGQVSIAYELSGTGQWIPTSVVTDASGAFTVSGLADYYYNLQATPTISGYRVATTAAYHVESSSPGPADITLIHEITISGRVLLNDSTNHNPTPPATGSVQVVLTAQGGFNTYATPDAAGNYSFPHMADFTSYTLQFQYIDYSKCTRIGLEASCDYIPTYLGNVIDHNLASYFTTSGSDYTVPDFAMQFGNQLSGTVTDSNGAPVPNVRVYARALVPVAGTWSDLGLAITDSSGHYVVPGLPDATYDLEFTDQSGTFQQVTLPYRLLSGGGIKPKVDQTLLRTSTISGAVRTDAGAPIAGVGIQAVREDPDTGQTFEQYDAATGPDGTYTLHGLRDGSYRVAFVSPTPDLAFQWYSDESTYYLPDPITVSDGDAVTGIDATLHRTAAISGAVTTPGGSSADVAAGYVSVEVVVYDYQSHTWVQTGDAYPVTLSAGVSRYSITGLAPDTYRLRFLYDGVSGSALLVSPRISVTAGTTSTYDARINISGANSTDIGLDAITGSKLGITVSGWAVEPGSPSTHVGLALNVGSSWYSVNADQSSADAVEAEADYVTVGPDHGFASTIAFAPGTYNACLWTSEPAGHASVLVACQTVNVAAQGRTAAKIDAMTGSLSGLSFSGYALFPDHDAAAVGVAINIGSSWYGFTANQHNTEGASDVPGASAEHGFVGTIPLPQGSYTACLWVSEPTGPAANAGCRTVVIPAQRPAASHLDSVTGGLGTVAVAGWDLFPDVPSTSVGLAINIGASWYSMTANSVNAGSLTAYPSAGSNHGFASTVAAPVGVDNVCIWTVEPSGPAVNIGCRTVTVTAPRPAVTHIDSVTGGLGTLTVTGWDVFPDSLSIQVGLAINIGSSWYSMTANAANSGSATAYPASTVDHGYSSTITIAPGTYNACIWTTEPSGPAFNTGCRTVTVTAPRPAVTHIDSVSSAIGSLTVAGWDVFPDSLATQVGLAINIGSSWYSMTANTPNSGSASAYPTSTVDHGYTSTLSIAPGSYNVCIWTVEPSGPAVNTGCRTVSVPAARPAVTSLPLFTGGIMGFTAVGSDYFPDSPATSVHLAVSLDDGSWTSVTADQYYPYDLPAGQYHGYSAVIPASTGKHTACMWTTEPSGPAVNIGCQTVIVANSQGVAAGFDSVLATKGGLEVWGYSKWLLSPDVHPNVSVNIGSHWYPFTANQDGSSEIGYGVMGFIPIAPGNYTVCMWTSQPDGTALNLGCRGASAYHIA
jgi:hypothetical protein